ncbi:hypothetical protein V3C99_008580 [Haemonchus contortus]|uniref:Reverse transcriptase n=1 Tax=Haemonchus contortus TaxID=6289 RepID=A0A7I4YNG3_HAECO
MILSPRKIEWTQELKLNASIVWNFHQEKLRIAIKTVDVEVYSKSTTLRALAYTYDPLGLLTPLLTNVKIFVQDLWAKQLAWDDPLDASVRQRWSELREELISPLPTVPRLVVSKKVTSDSFELCVFGDAFERAYACCAYVSSLQDTVCLVIASRYGEVAP